MTRDEVRKLAGVVQDTIKCQMDSVYRRLGASNAPHAVALAFVRGILTKEDVL